MLSTPTALNGIARRTALTLLSEARPGVGIHGECGFHYA
jgi:hypothetical protein